MTKRKASFYAVRVGRTPGVYEDWDSCKLQVHGFSGSKHKRFDTREEAESYVNDIASGSQVSVLSSPAPIQTKALADKGEKERHSHPPSATLNRDTCHRVSEKDTSLTKDIISGAMRVAIPKKEFTSLVQRSTKDPCEFFKVAMEDDELLYFKDEDDLKEFLKPYFENGNQTPYLQIGENFEKSSYEIQTDAMMENFRTSKEIFQLEFDGASKGNPGPAGAGALIRCPHGMVVLEVTGFLGYETNNFAEYQALILGLRAALSKGIRRIRAQGDSNLVCLQVKGVWKVNEKLECLCEEVKNLEKLFDEFSIHHVRREYNSEADALANEAVVHGETIREVVKLLPKCCVQSS